MSHRNEARVLFASKCIRLEERGRKVDAAWRAMDAAPPQAYELIARMLAYYVCVRPRECDN